MTVTFVPNDRGNPPGKLADAELHFAGGPLDGLKLIGFAIWERKNGGRNVTFPARQYSVNGERRSFALLRPIVTCLNSLLDLQPKRLPEPRLGERHVDVGCDHSSYPAPGPRAILDSARNRQ
jgi:hypothetical protein